MTEASDSDSSLLRQTLSRKAAQRKQAQASFKGVCACQLLPELEGPCWHSLFCFFDGPMPASCCFHCVKECLYLTTRPSADFKSFKSLNKRDGAATPPQGTALRSGATASAGHMQTGGRSLASVSIKAARAASSDESETDAVFRRVMSAKRSSIKRPDNSRAAASDSDSDMDMDVAAARSRYVPLVLQSIVVWRETNFEPICVKHLHSVLSEAHATSFS